MALIGAPGPFLLAASGGSTHGRCAGHECPGAIVYPGWPCRVPYGPYTRGPVPGPTIQPGRVADTDSGPSGAQPAPGVQDSWTPLAHADHRFLAPVTADVRAKVVVFTRKSHFSRKWASPAHPLRAGIARSQPKVSINVIEPLVCSLPPMLSATTRP